MRRRHLTASRPAAHCSLLDRPDKTRSCSTALVDITCAVRISIHAALIRSMYKVHALHGAFHQCSCHGAVPSLGARALLFHTKLVFAH
jgi:hypothetical protein